MSTEKEAQLVVPAEIPWHDGLTTAHNCARQNLARLPKASLNHLISSCLAEMRERYEDSHFPPFEGTEISLTM